MAKISEQAIAKREQGTDPDIALIKRTVAVGATDDELEMFLYDCKRRGVHPLDKLLHFTKRSGKYTPIVSIDLMRSRAAETNEMAGSDDAVFLPGHGKPESATVTVYRLTNGQRYGYTGTARWTEFYVNSPTWNKMPHVMLGKCAEAIALRKAFPQQLAGLYTREEMDQAGDIDIAAPPAQMKTITGGKTDYPTPQQQLATAKFKDKEEWKDAGKPMPEEPSDADTADQQENGAQTETEPEAEDPRVVAFSHEWWTQLPDAEVIKANVAAANQGWMPLLNSYKSMPADLQERWEKHKEHWKAIARRVEQDKMK